MTCLDYNNAVVGVRVTMKEAVDIQNTKGLLLLLLLLSLLLLFNNTDFYTTY